MVLLGIDSSSKYGIHGGDVTTDRRGHLMPVHVLDHPFAVPCRVGQDRRRHSPVAGQTDERVAQLVRDEPMTTGPRQRSHGPGYAGSCFRWWAGRWT